MIDRNQIDQIRQAIDLAEVIRDFVPDLSKSGKRLKGLCPFHAERTPSFFVNPELGVFKCFGCGEGGDAFGFLMKIEHLTFLEAATKLAERAGIALKMDKSVRATEHESERSRLQRVLAQAAEFYQRTLHSGTGQPFQRYLEKRGVGEKITHDFGLGAAPALGEAAIEHCLKTGFSINDLEKAGVAVKSAESGRFRDPMAGRLVFPIHDTMGHIVGFGGRLLEEEGRSPWNPEGRQGPKYLNTPDTPIFKKGTLLYGLPQAKPSLLSHGKVLIVEGYMDVIGCHQAGQSFAVAPLGTALTTDHVRLLKRYAREAILFFDADRAGWEATQRTLVMMIGLDLFVRVAPHPDNRDADEFIIQEGAETWMKLLGSAEEGVDYLLKTCLQRDPPPRTLQERIQVAEEMLRIIGESPNEIMKQEWVKKVGQRLSLDEHGLSRQLKSVRSVKKAGSDPSAQSQASPGRGSSLPSIEGEIIQLLLSSPDCWGTCELSVNDFTDPRAAEIFEAMRQIRLSTEGSFSSLADRLSPAAQDYFSGLAMQEKIFVDAVMYFSSAARRVKRLRVQRERHELEGKIRTLPEGDEKQAAINRYRQVLKELQHMDRGEQPLPTTV